MLRSIQLLFFERFEYLQDEIGVVGVAYKYKNKLLQLIGDFFKLPLTVNEEIKRK